MNRGEFTVKFELEVVKFNVADVITTSASGCTPPDMGDDEG